MSTYYALDIVLGSRKRGEKKRITDLCSLRASEKSESQKARKLEYVECYMMIEVGEEIKQVKRLGMPWGRVGVTKFAFSRPYLAAKILFE